MAGKQRHFSSPQDVFGFIAYIRIIRVYISLSYTVQI